jgi:hypothetical protein
MRAAFVACSGPSHRMWSEGINDETKPKPRRCDVGGIFAKPPPLMLSLFLIIATRGLHVALGLGRHRITCHTLSHTLHGPQRNLPKEQGAQQEQHAQIRGEG